MTDNVLSIVSSDTPSEEDVQAADYLRDIADYVAEGKVDHLCIGYMIDGTICNFSRSSGRLELLGMLEYLKANISTND